MSQIVEDAKAEYSRAQQRLVKALSRTPADKQKWSPSDTARTPVELVAHAANGTAGIGGMLKGEEFKFSSMAELDAFLRAEERKVETADAALAMLNEKSVDFIAWLDTLTDEQVASTVQLPFGPTPMAAAITFPADHIRGHAAQLEYIQTCYGDHDWGF